MKWWGAGISFLLCVTTGITIYRRSQRKVAFYAGLIDFCHYLIAEIGFAHQPLPQIVAAYEPQAHGDCRTLLNHYGQLLNQKQDLTYARCQQLTDDPTVADFLAHLGRMSSREEKDKIKTATAVFQTKHAEANHYLQTKASINLKLLIIMGIAGVILWI